MTNDPFKIESLDQAASVLGVRADSDDQAIRDAYIRQIKAHPPDIDPEIFEQVRDAYDYLRNPRHKGTAVFELAKPHAPLTDLLEEPCYVGPGPWLDVIKQGGRP